MNDKELVKAIYNKLPFKHGDLIQYVSGNYLNCIVQPAVTKLWVSDNNRRLSSNQICIFLGLHFDEDCLFMKLLTPYGILYDFGTLSKEKRKEIHVDWLMDGKVWKQYETMF